MKNDVIRIKRPDDWHLHLRDGEILRQVLPFTSAVFGRAIIMPNLRPPLTTVDAIAAYRDEILRALPAAHADASTFTPLMTCYLTDSIDTTEVAHGFESGLITAAKLYPAGATTNSDAGVTDITNIYPVLELMQKIDMPLLVHGEVVGNDTDIFDREALFIEQVLQPLRKAFPDLRIVLEHVTTRVAVDYVLSVSDGLAATITPHHLMINRNALFAGGLRPHVYCLPIVKREQDRLALRQAATSGDQRFFLGTDSAPHTTATKECDAGCAGVFNAPTAIACVAQVFDEDDALTNLETFASLNGPAFYRLPVNDDSIDLLKSTQIDDSIPTDLRVGRSADSLRVFRPESGLHWRVSPPPDA